MMRSERARSFQPSFTRQSMLRGPLYVMEAPCKLKLSYSVTWKGGARQAVAGAFVMAMTLWVSGGVISNMDQGADLAIACSGWPLFLS